MIILKILATIAIAYMQIGLVIGLVSIQINFAQYFFDGRPYFRGMFQTLKRSMLWGLIVAGLITTYVVRLKGDVNAKE